MAPTHRRGPWVPEEDQALLQLVREQGPNNWVRISQHMNYRSPKQCRERFHQNLKPCLNHEPISAEEGLVIERMVNEMGKRWAEIARRLGNRSDNAVKNWWNGSMNRKRRGLTVSTSRTYNGRVEAPYPRASMTMTGPAERSRFQTTPRSSWTSSPKISVDGASVTLSPLCSGLKSPSFGQFPLNERRESFSTFCDERSRSLQMEPVDNHRQLSPIFTFSSSGRPVEPPLTSPAFSEMSSTAPSMVSDHNSVSSASPRTLPSPQLLPFPVDIRQSYPELRRGSMPALQVRDEHYFAGSDNGDAKSVEYLSDAPSFRRWAPDFPTSSSYHQRSNSVSHTWPGPQEEPRTGSTSARDARMGLDSLLN